MTLAVQSRVSTTLEGCLVGRLGHPGHPLHDMHEYNAESPKQGRNRFNYIAKTKYIADLVIIYL